MWFTDIVCEGICKDGFCSELNAEKSCEDSDGRDYYHKGKVTGLSGNSNESNFEFEDVCLNDGMVKEYYCEEEKFRNDVFKCEFGCEDAKCLISKNLSNNEEYSHLYVVHNGEIIMIPQLFNIGDDYYKYNTTIQEIFDSFKFIN